MFIKNTYSENIIVMIKMTTTIKVNEYTKEQLKKHSSQTGISQLELADKYILNGIKSDEKLIKINDDKDMIDNKEDISIKSNKIEWKDTRYKGKPITDPEEIKKLLKHDNPKGDKISEALTGLVHCDKPTNAVQLKKNSYKRYK